ncbi:SDR family NAD(P)-dependent oxidoreductase [Bosea sp. (in: a-proteobacteria)]|uniref:SDR family NAD(P)-dependent oxidoreductase n=1 Tax=Bosea sp. (in: a-proteobacteria) TaxID=1871050 RepID=UPI0026251ECB|nr:SDR family oxidoreductase [Bosea sp. (in: a-proteobacteria)]MCO5093150.1 SDR family oxidoreductase [Bosea sp. (in: a-proteobacteria)]
MTHGQLQNRVAFVTGAGSGIGRATVLRFAREGARIAAFDRDAGALDETAREAGGEVMPLRGDVTSAADLDAAFAACASRFGDPCILVNCAGSVGHGGAIEDMSEEAWDALFEVNVKGTFLSVRKAAPAMRRNRRGSIVNLSSTAGLVGSAALGGYSASKGAVVLMTRSLAIRYAPDQVRVNCVCPGSIDTPMLRATFETAGPDPAARQAMADLYRSKQPLGRFGKPEEIAAAILFLASDEASFITGASLPVDGGRIA